MVELFDHHPPSCVFFKTKRRQAVLRQAVPVGTDHHCRLNLTQQCHHLVNLLQMPPYRMQRIVKLDQIQIKDHTHIIQDKTERIAVPLLYIDEQIGIADKALHLPMTGKQSLLFPGNPRCLHVAHLLRRIQHPLNITEAGDIRLDLLVLPEITDQVVAHHQKQRADSQRRRRKHAPDTQKQSHIVQDIFTVLPLTQNIQILNILMQ